MIVATNVAGMEAIMILDKRLTSAIKGIFTFVIVTRIGSGDGAMSRV